MSSAFWNWLNPRKSGRRSTTRRRAKSHFLLHGECLETRDLPAALIAHPDYVLLARAGPSQFADPGPTGYSPAQITQAYGINQITFDNGTVAGNGSGTTIAIVDAYNDPNIVGDLHQFDVQYGLPDPTLTVENQTGGGKLPTGNKSWSEEIALDVEWAHAVAPGASILLVEASNDSFDNLLAAVNTAAAAPGVVAVSMSWGGSEFAGETSDDSDFTTPNGHAGETFLASSGDSGAPVSYPAASPNVVSVGGTSLSLNAAGDILSESGWGNSYGSSGGGISAYESQPSYQNGIVTQTSTLRANPDVAYDADPNTGFSEYNSYSFPSAPWQQFGGTSDAAPQWAGIIAIADQGRALAGLGSLDGATQTLPKLYSVASSDFNDITTGTSLGTPNYSAGVGYDLVTGLGTPIANKLVADLVGATGFTDGPPPSLATTTVFYTFTYTVSGSPAPTVSLSSGSFPPGLSLVNGVLSGTPTTPGVFSGVVTASNSVGSATQSFTITVELPVSVSPGTLANGQVGVAYDQTLAATGGEGPYTFTVSAGHLPAGLSLGTGGTLSGTPTADGAFSFTVTATDASPSPGPLSGTQAYSVTVATPTLAMAPATLPNPQDGASYAQSVTASGGTGPYAYSIVAGGLPPGLSINGSSGAITGTPTAAGAFSFTVRAIDSSGGSGPFAITKAYAVPVGAPAFVFGPASLNNSQVGASYSQTITIAGGTAPYTNFTISAGALPAGLILNANTGVIGGTPTAGGTFSFTVSAIDSSTGSGPFTQGISYSLTVAAPSFVFSPTSLANAQVGAAYSQTITVAGGTASYKNFTISAGALPAGLTLNAATGVIGGTPQAIGTFDFTVSATDSSTGTGPFTQGNAYSLIVAAPTFLFSPSNLLNAQVGAGYSQAVIITGGTAPYQDFTISAGALPAGLSIDAGTGVIGGTPTAGGTFNFTVSATDSSTGSGPFTQGNAYALTVAAPTFVFSPTNPANAQVGAAYAQTITVTGGTASYKNFTISAGALPAGLTINPNTGAIGGTPTAGGTFNFTVSATDSSTGTGPFTQGIAYALTVAAPTFAFSPASPANAQVGASYSQTISVTGATAPYAQFTISAGVLPAGLTINAGSGVISGTPTAGGTFNFTVSATDSSTGTGPFTQGKAYALTVTARSFVFSPANPSNAQVGASYAQTITITGGTAPYKNFTISTGALPAGLSINASTGVISGTATAGGIFNFTVSATDSSTGSGPFTQGIAYSLTVAAPTFVFSPTDPANAQVGVGYARTISVTGGTAPYRDFTISAGALPAGLTINANSGIISGTPTAGGSFSFTVSASDSFTGAGPFTEGDVSTLTVAAPTFVFGPPNLNGAKVGAGFSQTVTVGGGTAPYGSFTISSGALPAGLTLNPNSGAIGGTPTAGGTFNFTVSATDSSTGTGPFTQGSARTITVAAPTFVFSPSSLGNAQVGASFSQAIAVTGATAPYSQFTISAGALPAGLTINAGNGIISGTPTAGGAFNFTVSATDSSTGTGPFTQSVVYALAVAAPTFVFAPSNLAGAQVGAVYSQNLSVNGGTAPFKSFTVSAGSLPAGLSINPGTGAIGGTPTTGGTFSFTVSATDSSTGTGPFTQGKAYTLTVAAPTIVLSPNTLSTGEAGIAFNQPLTASGGTAPYLYGISGGALPDGLSINASTGAITGTPTATGPSTFTVSVTDSSAGTGPYTSSQTFTLNVNAPLAISTTTLDTFWTVNAAGYDQTIATAGGVAPTTFAVSSGTLPAGLSLDANTGAITGAPTAVGSSTFTVTATDSLGATANQSYTVIVIPSEFAYDQATHQLTITATTAFPNFQYTQATTLVAGIASSVYTFTLNDNASPPNSVSQSFPDTALSVSTQTATVSVNGIGGTAILITNDTYAGPNGTTLETPEAVSLGSLANPGVGTLSKYTTIDGATAPYTFVALTGFPISYAYVGRNDGTVLLYGSAGEQYNGFVSAGNYSYIGGPGMYHEAEGATSVYGYSAGQATDFAYQYSANPGSTFVVSGTAYSYMSTTDTVNGVTQSYFNEAIGFQQNTGVSKNPGKDFAYIIDSPGNDTFVGQTTESYMFSTGPSGNFTEFDAAYGFALVFGESIVGGVDTATNDDPTHNILVGFNESAT